MERSEARTWLGSPLAGAVGVLGVGLVAICCTDGHDHASWVAPAAASNLTAALADGGRVELSWSDRSSEGGFRIERRVGAGAFVVVDRVPANTTTFDDDRAPADEVVEYRVIATSVAGDAPASNVVTVLTVKPPAQPASAAVSDTEVDLSWLDLTSIETGFRVERRVAGGGSFAAVAGSPAPANATSFRDVGLTPGATYEYRVIAETPLGDSAPSAVLLATPGSVPLQVDTTTLPAALQSWPYDETVSASGGSGQGRTWAVSAGSLGGDLQLVDGAAAVISGTPYPPVPYSAPSPLSFTLQVTDSASNVAQQAYTLGIDPLRITTHAGDGSLTYAGDGAQADASGLDADVVAVDAAGNVHASAAYRLFRVDATSLQVTTVAGDGTAGDGGDGGLATNATLQRVSDLAFDAAGGLFVLTSTDGAGTGARIRRIDATSGVITRVGGGGANAADDGAQATDVDLSGASRLAVDGAGNVYFVHGHAVRRIDASGVLSTVAGDVVTAGDLGDGGAATGARFSSPGDLAVDPLTGAIFVADTGNHRVRSFVVGGSAQTVAGTGASFSSGYGEGGAATAVDLPSPVAVAFDTDGNLFVGQPAAVRRVERATGLLRTFAGAQLLAGTGTGSGTPTGTGSGTTTTTGSTTSGSGTIGSGSGTTSGSGLPTGSGSGTAPTPPGDGGPALQATIGYVRALAVDTTRQRVLVADRGYFRVRLVAR